MPTEKKAPARVVTLHDIQPLAERLNQVSDDLNVSLKDIEARIVALNIGLDVTVELRPEKMLYMDASMADQVDEQPGAYWRQDRLGLCRFGSGWRLAVLTTHSIEHNKQRAESGTTITPLLEAPREDRLAAVGKIPDLLAAIQAKASAAIERIEQARALADSLS